MGAEYFVTTAHGKTAMKAFKEAVKVAEYNHGHAGYTGTIAEVGGFSMFPKPDGILTESDLWDWAEAQSDDCLISDKWGNCGCVAYGNNQFMFFGWASS